MKTTVLSLAILSIAMINVSHSNEYQGDFFIIGLSSGCDSAPYRQGGWARFRMNLAGVGNTGDYTKFGIHWGRFTTSYSTKGKPSPKFKKANSAGIATGYWTWNNSKVKYTELYPKSIDENTEKIDMDITIKNFDNVKGCTAIWSGSITKRP